MPIGKLANHDNKIGEEIYSLIKELFPICRSITGNGVRQTLKIIGSHIPLEVYEVPSGTPVFDWTVPKEWNIRDAWVKDSNGIKIVDFQESNLHVVNYSVPFKGKLSLSELKPHLFSLPEHPEWIPYRTTYYKSSCGIYVVGCLCICPFPAYRVDYLFLYILDELFPLNILRMLCCYYHSINSYGLSILVFYCNL